MSVMGIQFVQQFCIAQMVKIVLCLSGSVYLTKNLLHTANSIKVDIDNSQMCNMIDRVPKE